MKLVLYFIQYYIFIYYIIIYIFQQFPSGLIKSLSYLICII